MKRPDTIQPLPGVFVGKQVTLKEGAAAPVVEFQALPHIIFRAQYLTSSGAESRGHEFHIAGRLDGERWWGRARPDAKGAVVVHLPHGLQDVQVLLSTNEHSALRVRPGAGKPLVNDYRNIRLGTLNDDAEGFEIIRYKAPIVLIDAVDADGKQVSGFHVTSKYTLGQERGLLRIDSLERQNDGRYRTSQMLPDEEVTFTATAAGYQSASEKLTLAEGETKELVITLKPAPAAGGAPASP